VIDYLFGRGVTVRRVRRRLLHSKTGSGKIEQIDRPDCESSGAGPKVLVDGSPCPRSVTNDFLAMGYLVPRDHLRRAGTIHSLVVSEGGGVWVLRESWFHIFQLRFLARRPLTATSSPHMRQAILNILCPVILTIYRIAKTRFYFPFIRRRRRRAVESFWATPSRSPTAYLRATGDIISLGISDSKSPA
jgi:hypothetical protein